MTNQAWQISAPGHLSLVDLPEAPPRPGPGEVLVRMKAVSLNFRDLLILHHNPKYPAATTPDLIPCCDGAGIVEAVGEARDAAAAEAREWQPGDRILLHPNSWRRGGDVRAFDPTQTLGSGAIPGTLRRWAVWRADQLIRVPAGLSLAEAATLFTSGVTAWNALMHGAVVRLGGGEQQQQSPAPTVVTQGTGGVSCWAIMIAAAAGATVIATSSSAAKLAVARRLGATHLINYREQPDWAAEVLRVTAGQGADLAVEVVAGRNVEQTVRAIRRGGVVAHVGMLDAAAASTPVNVMAELWYGSKTIQGLIGSGSKEMAEELVAFVQGHDLHPPIAQTFDFEQASEAYEALKTLNEPGKIVIEL